MVGEVEEVVVAVPPFVPVGCSTTVPPERELDANTGVEREEARRPVTTPDVDGGDDNAIGHHGRGAVGMADHELGLVYRCILARESAYPYLGLRLDMWCSYLKLSFSEILIGVEYEFIEM
uniref:Uncharacterized protein n=1 Tax=Oryza nivara TaxID=4536 RepID=A0A0E0HMU8_ORYNI